MVLAGPREALENVVAHLEAHAIDARFLPVSHAFHSHLLTPMLDAFAQSARSLPLQAEHIPLISTLTGNLIPAGVALPTNYWREQTRSTVQFLAGVQTAHEQGGRVFIEIGPDDTLTRMGQRCLPDGSDIAWFSSLKQGHDDWKVLLSSVATLYVHGHKIDWEAFEAPYAPMRTRLSLPTYPFERQRYWFTQTSSARDAHDRLPYRQDNENRIQQKPKENVISMNALQEEHEPNDASRRERLLSQLRVLLGSLLHIEPAEIAGDTSFLEIGADFIVLIDAVRQIEQTFGLKLSIRQLFAELSTLDALATHLDQVLPADAYPQGTMSASRAVPDHKQEADIAPLPLEQPFREGEYAATATKQAQAPRATTDIEHIFAQQLDLLSNVLSRQLDVLRAHIAGVPHEQQLESRSPHNDAGIGSTSDTSSQTEPLSFQPTQTPYIPYQPIRPKSPETLNALQQAHLDALRARLIQRTQGSRDYAQRYRSVLADNRTSAGFRFSIKEMLYPIVAEQSRGAHFWDLDGNCYLDITMGFGVNLFGHHAPFIQEALTQQLEMGIQLGPQSRLAGAVATLIHELTGLERVAFCNSGTEAVMTAIRLARTATGKSKIVLFSGSYHGTFDGVLARSQPQNEHVAQPLAPGVPEKMADDVLVLPYGSAHTLDIIQAHAPELAAVLVEPVQSRHPDVQPREFLQQLRVLTSNAGIALIFDETITGFRIHPGGAQAWFNVQADLATYGKIIGGGMPIGVVAGKAQYLDGIDGGMWHYGDLSYPQAETTFFAGTFCKHPLAMSSAYAVLRHLKSQGPTLQERLNEKTAQLATRVNAFFRDEQVPITCIHFGSLFRFSFTQNMDLFFYHLLDKGIYIWEGRNCFLSTAHTDEDIATLILSIKETIRELRSGGFLPPPPSEGSNKRHSEDAVPGSQDRISTAAFPPEVLALRKQEARSETVERSFPLTAAQQNFWAASQVNAGGGFNAYIEAVLLQLDGEFSFPAMQNAFRMVVNRHEALRTVISAQGDRQHVLLELPIDVSYQDLSGFQGDERQPLVSRWLTAERYQGLDLTHGPLVRLSMLKLAAQCHLLLFAAHHIIADGWSITLVLQEIAQMYTAPRQHRPYHLPPVLQFREYVHWQEQQVQQGTFLADERFWLAKLAEPFPVLALPFDHPRSPYKTFTGARVHMAIDADLQQALRQLARQYGCTLYMVLLAAYLLWLHHVNNQDDVVVGVPTAGRICTGSETLVGHAMNLFPLRSTLVGSPTFLEYLYSVKQHLLELYEHQDYPLVALQKKLDPQGQLYTLYTTFNLDPAIALDSLGNLTVTNLTTPVEYVKFDICVFVTTNADQLDIDVHYNRDLFEPETMQALIPHLRTLLENMCTHSELPIWRQSLLTNIFPLSFAQQQLWLLEQSEPGASTNHVAYAVRLRGKLQVESFQRSLKEIIERHESLRTTFQLHGNTPVQIVAKVGNVPLSLLDLSELVSEQREAHLQMLTRQEAQSPFNLAHGPLFRVTLLRLSASEHALLLTMHHIISDHWSLNIFLHELSRLYDAFSAGKASPLIPLPRQYADFAHWQRSWLQGKVLDRYTNYWTKQLRGATPLELPTDRPRSALAPRAAARDALLGPYALGAFHAFKFSAQLSEKLVELSSREDVTLFMTLLAAFQTLLYRYSWRSDLVVGTGIANRTQRETEGIIGPFENSACSTY